MKKNNLQQIRVVNAMQNHVRALEHLRSTSALKVGDSDAFLIIDLNLQVRQLFISDELHLQGPLLISSRISEMINLAIKSAIETDKTNLSNQLGNFEVTLHQNQLKNQTNKVILSNGDYPLPTFLLTDKHLQIWKNLNQNNLNKQIPPWFGFNLHAFCRVNMEIFNDAINLFHAGKLRTLPIKAGNTEFPDPKHLEALLEQLFIPLSHPALIIDWMVYILGYIHPFTDGNRRCCEKFINYYLMHNGALALDWSILRPIWENGVQIVDFEERKEWWINSLLIYLNTSK